MYLKLMSMDDPVTGHHILAQTYITDTPAYTSPGRPDGSCQINIMYHDLLTYSLSGTLCWRMVTLHALRKEKEPLDQ